jgi:hypothetical protein
MVDDVNVCGCRADSAMLVEKDRCLVINEDGDNRDREPKILKHSSEPECLLGDGTRCIVLSLTGGLGSYTRERELPGDGATILK